MKSLGIKKMKFIGFSLGLLLHSVAIADVDNVSTDLAFIQECNAMVGAIENLCSTNASNEGILSVAATTLDKATEGVSIVIAKPNQPENVKISGNAVLNAVATASSALVNNSNAGNLITAQSSPQLLDVFVRGANSTAKNLNTTLFANKVAAADVLLASLDAAVKSATTLATCANNPNFNSAHSGNIAGSLLNVGLLFNYVVYSQSFSAQNYIDAAARAAFSIVAALDSVASGLQIVGMVSDQAAAAQTALGLFYNQSNVYNGAATIANMQQVSAAILAYVAQCMSLTAISEYPAGNKNPYGIAAGNNGTIWFGEWNGRNRNNVGVMDTEGNILGWVNVGDYPENIVTAADGTIWGTYWSDNKIFSINPTTLAVTKTVTNFGRSHDACCICVGPDGNIWFAEGGTFSFFGDNFGYSDGQLAARGALARLNPVTGDLSEFDGLGAVVWGVAAGPDGNIWFTDIANSRVGKIAVDGTGLVYYGTPTVNSAPTSIVAGSDGNMWFLETGSNSIARVTPAGDITEYAVPVANNGLYNAIAAGPDGNIWFCDGNGNTVWLLNPTTGVAVAFALPTQNSGPFGGITAGPDGNIWFTEFGANQVGTLKLM